MPDKVEAEKLECNFIIANFIGFKYPDSNSKVFRLCHAELHNYSDDWNLLMPVLKKIYDLQLRKHREWHVAVAENFLEWDIDEHRLAAINFIKWYNQHKTP